MKLETPSNCFSGMRTGMAQAIFTEVAERLDQLLEDNEDSAIDLRSLPLTDADLAELEELLGKGEVAAELNVLGPTSIWETAYAGVWWVRHFGAGQKIATEQLAITAVPEILKAHNDDIAAAAQRIREGVTNG